MLNFVEEVDVTPVRLSVALEHAVMQHVMQDDGDLYVMDDHLFPVWVHAPRKCGFIGFNTWMKFRESSTQLERLTLANSFNQENFMLTTYVSGDRLRMDHSISCRDGLIIETFVRVCRNFSLAVQKSINAHDSNYAVLMTLKELAVFQSESPDA